MEKMIIELFSGSKKVSEEFEKNGWNSFTVDNNPALNPHLCSNIQDIDLNMLPDKVNFIWASPDCTTFSRAASQEHWIKITNKYRQYSYIPFTQEAHQALTMLDATLNIIRWYPRAQFIIENPIGRLQHMEAMRKLGHYRFAVNYADFGFEYSKETYLFSNCWLPFSTKKVSSVKPGLRSVNSKFQRSIVPSALVSTIYDYLF
jgi:site-specific DNA-cytosine methylase